MTSNAKDAEETGEQPPSGPLTAEAARPPGGTVLCALEALTDPGSRSFEFREGQARFELFVVRFGGQVFAYENRCPHAGYPLDGQLHQFLNRERTAILCAAHGAQFVIETGACFSGPCKGEALKPVAITVADGLVQIAHPGEAVAS